MDPITTAILAALAAGVTQGTVADTYNGLKQLIKTKFNNKIIKMIESLEKKPHSVMGREWLQEKIKTNQIDKDPEILEVAKKLMDEMKTSGDEKHIMQAEGNFIAQADHGSTSSVTINQ